MKPSEIAPINLKKNWKGEMVASVYGRAYVRNFITPYINKDCVLAYYKNQFGICFIIKTKLKYKAFFNIEYLDGGYRFFEKPLEQTIPIILNGGTIVEREEWDKMTMLILAQNI